MHAKPCVGSLDGQIADLAAAQHGVVAREHLFDLGFERGAIAHRLRCGRLHRIHRGVYAVGHKSLSPRGRWLAAVLAIGTDAALSHRTAAALWQLRPSSSKIEVTSPRRLQSRSRIATHQGPLPHDEVTVHAAIPVTTVPRTLLDLASVLVSRQVERAMEEAEHRRLDDPLSLIDLLKRYPRRRGTATIRAILELRGLGTTYTRSDLEEDFLAFVRAHALPKPELNAAIELSPGRWIEADCLWRVQRLIVELDSRGYHDTTRAFESDRTRDRAASVAGWTVIRVTWRQIHNEPSALSRDLYDLLARA